MIQELYKTTSTVHHYATREISVMCPPPLPSAPFRGVHIHIQRNFINKNK